ncbi:MAG TPA: hypothetical protein DCP31_09980 [Cyanobacteria bacterium UBA8543]|nr:hypothetical protein [Cyanobacteria bacterium UBA8543]
MNIDELTAKEIETLKVRVHCLSQELWESKEYPNRINTLIMLTAAASELLLLETNQNARREGLKLAKTVIDPDRYPGSDEK